jgi:hypothetical protein
MTTTSTTRTLTFRLPDTQVAALETVARFDGVALAEELREGVELLLAARRGDPDFRGRVEDSIQEARTILAGVEGGDEILEALTPRLETEAQSASVAQAAGAQGGARVETDGVLAAGMAMQDQSVAAHGS